VCKCCDILVCYTGCVSVASYWCVKCCVVSVCYTGCVSVALYWCIILSV
jgi:hypothetical protein